MSINWTRTKLTINQGLRVRCEPGWRLDKGWSERLEDFDLWCVWAGRGVMRLRDRSVDLRPGVCILARPGGLYLAEQDRRERLGVNAVHFDLTDRRTGKRPADRHLPSEVHELIDAGYADAVTRRIADLARHRGTRQDAAGALLRGFLTDLETRSDHGVGATMSATERHYHEVVAGLASRIATSPHDVPPIDELAREAGYSVDHFTRVFRQVTGRTPQAFIVDSRIDRARQLLRESSMTISQIAGVLGYRDVFFFSRQFKRKTGRPPSACRAT
jgi:AraC-like DNA-binding protein